MRDLGLDRNIGSLRPAAGVENPAARSPALPDLELYTEANFGGRSYPVKRDITNLGPTDFNDSTASIVVNSGRWELCTDGEYGGRCAVMGPGRYPALGGLTNQISSVRRVR